MGGKGSVRLVSPFVLKEHSNLLEQSLDKLMMIWTNALITAKKSLHHPLSLLTNVAFLICFFSFKSGDFAIDGSIAKPSSA